MRSLAGTGSRGLTGIPAKDGLWVRPRAMFLETVEIDGRIQPRFAYVGPA